MNIGSRGDARIGVLGVLTLVALLVMVAQLFRVQVLQHNYYVQLADKEHIKKSVLLCRALLYTGAFSHDACKRGRYKAG